MRKDSGDQGGRKKVKNAGRKGPKKKAEGPKKMQVPFQKKKRKNQKKRPWSSTSRREVP